MVAVDYKALKHIAVDDCTGNTARSMMSTFIGHAALQNADVVVTNHALLCPGPVAEGRNRRRQTWWSWIKRTNCPDYICRGMGRRLLRRKSGAGTISLAGGMPTWTP